VASKHAPATIKNLRASSRLHELRKVEADTSDEMPARLVRGDPNLIAENLTKCSTSCQPSASIRRRQLRA
jgi:hypothetical protein